MRTYIQSRLSILLLGYTDWRIGGGKGRGKALFLIKRDAYTEIFVIKTVPWCYLYYYYYCYYWLTQKFAKCSFFACCRTMTFIHTTAQYAMWCDIIRLTLSPICCVAGMGTTKACIFVLRGTFKPGLKYSLLKIYIDWMGTGGNDRYRGIHDIVIRFFRVGIIIKSHI